MALSEIDRNLLKRCLAGKPQAWEDFVDRFLGLVIHVINHTAQARSIRLSTQDREDLSADVFLTLVKDNFKILRRFRGESSLATYLTVISRRVVVRELLRRKKAAGLGETAKTTESSANPKASPSDNHEERIADRDEVERLLKRLDGKEADVVRMFHLEGKSYQEISSQVEMPENSIGPTLTRARAKLQRIAQQD